MASGPVLPARSLWPYTRNIPQPKLPDPRSAATLSLRLGSRGSHISPPRLDEKGIVTREIQIMTARKAAIGLCMICALLVAAVTASGAGAATTAYTCVPHVGGPLNGTCSGAGAAAEHVEVPPNTKTNISAQSTGNITLKATTAGVTVEITATALDAEEAGPGEPAFMENREVGGVME